MTPIPQNVAVTDAEFLPLLNKRLREIGEAIASSAARSSVTAGSSTQYSGTHAQRLSIAAALVAVGTLFYETDRTVLYMAVTSGTTRIWSYVSGMLRGTLSPDQKPGDLNNSGDAGFRFYSTDFQHTYRWTGTGWLYATEDGDDGSAYVGWWTQAPSAGVWQLCDGSAVTQSRAIGTTGAVTVPNLIGYYTKGANAYTGANVGPVAPGVTGGNSGPTGAINAGTAPGYAASADHSHIWAGAVDTTGEPAHVELIPYYRL